MSASFDRVLHKYQERSRHEAEIVRRDGPAALARRDDFLLEVGEPTARFLQSLAIARNAQCIVELGTSYGYSTLFLADAARATGGLLHSYEISAEKQDHARRELDEAGLSKYVEWHCGDAVSLLEDLSTPIDFVLLDIWKDLYIPCLRAFRSKLACNAVIAADNMLFPEMAREDADAYRTVVREDKGLQSVLLPIGSGIELSCLWESAI